MYIQEIKNTTSNAIGSLTKKIRKNKIYMNWVLNETKFAPDDVSLAMRLYLIRNDIKEMPTCLNCGKVLYKQNIKYCSHKCSNIVLSKNKEINKIRAKKVSDFYNNLSKEQKDEIVKKIQATNMERYDTVCSLHNEDVKKKKLETWKKNGYTNPNKSKKVRNKIRKTCNELYGGDAPTSSEKVKDKVKKTCIKLYGVPNPAQNEKVQNKMHETYMKRTGFDHPMHNPDVIKKMQNTFFNNEGLGKHKKGYRYKRTIINNKEFLTQGYESQYLNILAKKYNVDDIENSISFMRNLDIVYDKHRIYIPDFYIEKENLIIEVKSLYLLNKNYDNILKKANAVVNKGFNFIIAVSSNGTYFKNLEIKELKEWKH